MMNFDRYAAFSLRMALAAAVVTFGIIPPNNYVGRATPAAFAAGRSARCALRRRQTSGPECAAISLLNDDQN